MPRESNRHRARVRCTSLALVTLLAAGTSLGWAVVHVRLLSSIPAPGAVLEAPPDSIELRFSGPVDANLSSAVLVYPSGDSIALAFREAPGDDGVLVADTPPVEVGDHVLRWRVVSVDGHPARGEVPFTVRSPGRADASSEAVPPATQAARRASGATGPQPGGEVEAAADFGAALIGGLGLACLLAFAGLLWCVGAGALFAEASIRRACLVSGWAALLLLGADLALWLLGVRATGAALAGFGPGLASRTGAASMLRILALAAALAVMRYRYRGRAAAFLAVAGLLVGSVAGHAAAMDSWITIPANAVHLGGVLMWIGGLLLIVLLPGRPGPRGEQPGDWSFGAVAGAVSSTALLAVLLVAASGVVQAVFFVGNVGAYASTPYGRLILLKGAGLAVLIGFGAWHRYRLLPKLAADEEAGSVALKRSVRIETLVMLFVVLLAAYLAHVPTPAS